MPFSSKIFFIINLSESVILASSSSEPANPVKGSDPVKTESLKAMYVLLTQLNTIAAAANNTKTTAAINVPDVESYVGIMHTLFTFEDLYDLKIDEVDGEPVIRLNKSAPEYLKMVEMFLAWQKQAQMRRDGEIIKEDYDQWRYKYPELDKSNKRRHKMTPSTKLNDAITDELMKAREKSIKNELKKQRRK